MTALVLLSLLIPAASAAPLSLEEYLGQVRSGSPGVQGAALQAEGGEARLGEGGTVTAPSFFAKANWVDDQTYSFQYAQAKTNTYSLGLAYNAPIGLQTKFTYGLTSYNFSGIVVGPSTFDASFWDAQPKLEASFPLWGGGFGRETRAQRDALNAAAAASAYGAKAAYAQAMINAEIAYWRLSAMQQSLALQKETLARAEKLAGWARRRASQGLSDRADALQAESALTLRKLELETIQTDLLVAAREFHALRGETGEALDMQLQTMDQGLKAPFALPPEPQAAARDDVRAAQARIAAAEATSQLGAEKNRPRLDLVGSYAFNGRNASSREAMGDAFGSGHPTRMVGVSFTAPLNVFTTASAVRGYRLEVAAAEKNFQQKLVDQRLSYQELKQRVTDLERQVKLARELESTQKQKSEHEQRRLNLGRTTTFQSLTFEQDYSTAELTRVRLELALLSARAQFKAFDQVQAE